MIKIRGIGKAEKITSLLGMAKGLMFSKKKSLLFEFKKENKVGIHMLFVFFPLIVVWLDSKKRIKKVRKMIPFLSVHEERAKYVLEVPFEKRLFSRLNRMKSLRF